MVGSVEGTLYYGINRGHVKVSFEDVGITPDVPVWASVTEVDPNSQLPIDGDAKLMVQQVVPNYGDNGVDVMVWIDMASQPLHYKLTLFLMIEI